MPLTHLPEKNDLLWHYTQKDILEEIARSKQLRTTSAAQLNDPSEYLYLAERVQTEYDRAHEQLTLEKGDIATPNELARLLQSKDGKIVVKRDESCPFIISFSLKRNLLPQWKIYTAAPCSCSPSGYALGFSTMDLQLLANRNDGQLLGVYYLGEQEAPPITTRIEGNIAEITAFEAAWIKHPDYVYEQEARIVLQRTPENDRKVTFEQKRERLRMDLEPPSGAPIRPRIVMVGPGPGQQERYEHARAVIDRHGWVDTKLERSDTPMNW